MKSVTKLFKYLKPYWHWAVLAPLLMVLEVVMDLMQPAMIQRIIDEGIAQLDMAVVIRHRPVDDRLCPGWRRGGIGLQRLRCAGHQGFGADLRSALFARCSRCPLATWTSWRPDS